MSFAVLSYSFKQLESFGSWNFTKFELVDWFDSKIFSLSKKLNFDYLSSI